MVFSSAIFIFGFLPLFLICYYLVSFRHKSLVITAFSYLFYGWWRIDFLGLLILVTVANFLIGQRIADAANKASARRWLVLAIVIDLGVLGYFKYFNFFIDSLETLINNGESFSPLLGQIVLPIGISFYIFQAISYVMDVYRGDAPPARSFLDFAAFKSMFPQLVAGPVIRYKDIEDQFSSRPITVEMFGYGALRFFTGLAKKVLIADSVAPIADAAFAHPNPSMADTWIGIVAYSVQLYFDFSAYSSMAVGLALMMGFSFIENFRFPYVSRSITEFWRRWHISLSTWLRVYLYIPLGGNRHGQFRTYLNLIITMVLGGFWHGANWTFILWGLLHGSVLATERYVGITAENLRPFWAWIVTILIVMFGWVLFRAPNIGVAAQYYGGMLGQNGFPVSSGFAWQLSTLGLLALIAGVAIALFEPQLNRWFGIEAISEPLKKAVLGPVPLRGVATVCLLGLLAITKLLADNDTPFLYFQF